MGTNSILYWFGFNSAYLGCLWWLKLSSMEIYQNIPRDYRGNIRAGGVIPHQITLESPRLEQLTQRLSCLDHWPVLHINLINPNPNTHVGEEVRGNQCFLIRHLH